MGPGTGLGVSGLVPIEHGWVPLMTEGGHVDFAPTDDTDDRCVHASRFASFEKLPMVHHVQVRLQDDNPRALLVPAGWWCQVQAGEEGATVSVLALT